MGETTLRNFHIPLSEELYRALRDEAAGAKQPATALARYAIEAWLHHRKTAALHEAIAKYAAECAGSTADFDPELEAASLEQLRARKRKRR